MKTNFWLPGCAAAALLTAGCGPDLAQGGYDSEEQQWQKEISENYSGYRPPRIAPPAIVDHASPEALEKQRRQGETAPGTDSVSEIPAPAEDKDPVGGTDLSAARTVDSAADKTAPGAAAGKADAKKADAKKADAGKPAAADSDCDIYVVKSGDTPGSIAHKYYGKASHYDLILRANPQIKDPKQIPIGTKLRIPKL